MKEVTPAIISDNRRMCHTLFGFISAAADLLNLDQVRRHRQEQFRLCLAEEKSKRTETNRELCTRFYSPIAALITMPIEDAEKFVRKEPLEQFYDVGNELGR